MMMARSTVGRLVQTYSEDGGETWDAGAAKRSRGFVFSAAAAADPQLPRPVVRVEQDVAGGDLEGVSTGPLVCGDFNGLAERVGPHFKTIEVSGGMEDVDRVPPQYPVSPVIALPELGSLPEDFATFDYANAWFHEDRVLPNCIIEAGLRPMNISAEAVTLGERKSTVRKPGELVLRVYPLGWFYDSDGP